MHTNTNPHPALSPFSVSFFFFFWGWSTEGWSRSAPGSHPFVEKLECKWSYIIDAGWKGSKWKQVPITGGCMLGPITVRLTFFKVKSIHQNIISLFFSINKSQASLCFLFPRRISGATDVCTPRVLPLRMMEWLGKVCRVEYHRCTEGDFVLVVLVCLCLGLRVHRRSEAACLEWLAWFSTQKFKTDEMSFV